MATAWEPYQELFQGVIVCLHSDFRIGGLEAGPVQDDPRQDLPDAGRFRANCGRDIARTSPARSGEPSARGRRAGQEAHRVRLGRAGHRLPAQASRSARANAVRRLRLPRRGPERRRARRRTSPGSAGAAGDSTPDELKPALDDLASITWTRFRHNFLRFNVTPADLDWFDDHAAVVSNARLAAQLARAGGCRGILLDTEQYQGKLFDYRKQRDASRRTWAEYAAQARRRGREVHDGVPGRISRPDRARDLRPQPGLEAERRREEDRSRSARDGLLVPFLDGMIEASQGKTRLVDGHEMSYGYRDAGAFVQAHRGDQDQGCRAGRRSARNTSDVVSAGFGLWLDYDWRKKGWNTAEVEKNYFSPARFETSLRAAVEQSDEYVWIYTEKPRWWSERAVRSTCPCLHRGGSASGAG